MQLALGVEQFQAITDAGTVAQVRKLQAALGSADRAPLSLDLTIKGGRPRQGIGYFAEGRLDRQFILDNRLGFTHFGKTQFGAQAPPLKQRLGNMRGKAPDLPGRIEQTAK